MFAPNISTHQLADSIHHERISHAALLQQVKQDRAAGWRQRRPAGPAADDLPTPRGALAGSPSPSRSQPPSRRTSRTPRRRSSTRPAVG